MKLLIKSAMSAGIILILAAAMASNGQATEFRLTAGSSHPPIIPWVGIIKDFVVPQSVARLKAMGSPHTIKWTEAYAGALYNFQNTLEGVQDGLADLGWVGTLWEPNKLPLQNVTFYAPFASANVGYLSEIQAEMHANIPELNKQWRKYNQVYLGPQTIDEYTLISKTPIKTVADLKGKKIYVPGAIARWLDGTGAVPVNGGLPVYYNGLKTGIADAAILPGTGILPFKIHEVAPYIIEARLGGGITGALTMNLDTWNKLPPEMQKMFRQLGKEYGERVVKRVTANRIKHFKILAAKGAKISLFPLSERKKWAALLPNIAQEWVERNESKGLPARQILAAYMDGVRKRGETPLRNWDK